MDKLQEMLNNMSDEDRKNYVYFLRAVVGSPSVGGSGQYLGSLAPLVFATVDQRIDALREMNEYADRKDPLLERIAELEEQLDEAHHALELAVDAGNAQASRAFFDGKLASVTRSA